MIIALNGFARSGKDTAAKFLVDKGFKKLSFAEPVRQGLLAMNPIVDVITTRTSFFGYKGKQKVNVIRLIEVVAKMGWEEAKDKYPEVRRLMQYYATEAGRDIHGSDCWLKIAEKEIRDNPQQDYVITDLRFENERLMVASLATGFTVTIIRPNVTTEGNHSSEKPLERVNYKLVNDGSIEELHEKVEKFYKQFRGVETIIKNVTKKHKEVRACAPLPYPY